MLLGEWVVSNEVRARGGLSSLGAFTPLWIKKWDDKNMKDSLDVV